MNNAFKFQSIKMKHLKIFSEEFKALGDIVQAHDRSIKFARPHFQDTITNFLAPNYSASPKSYSIDL